MLDNFNFFCFRAVKTSRMEASVILPILKKKLAFLSGTVSILLNWFLPA